MPRSPSRPGRPALVVSAALFCSALPAAAETPVERSAEGGRREHEEDAPRPIPPARDTLGGHLALGAAPLVAVPFGSLDGDNDFADAAGTGYGIGGDLGYGLSRSAVAGAWGQYVSYGTADGCGLGSEADASCRATSFGIGPFVRYHLVQGTRYDPWAAVGIGYRRLEVNAGGDALEYTGFEWLRLQMGGDWYPLSQLGLGPYLELDFGTFLEPPGGAAASVYANFAVGLRVALDVPGK